VHAWCRCCSLQALDVHVPRLGQTFSFQGFGQTAAEQRDSMQQQIEAICSSSSFLAPSSWPASQCLTTLVLDNTQLPRVPSGCDIQPSEVLSAAVHSVSLVDLDLVFDDILAPEDYGSLQQLPNLTRLSRLSVSFVDEGSAPGQAQHVLTVAAHVSSLQQLRVDADFTSEATVCHLPPGHQQPHLTRLELHGLQMNLANLSEVPAVVNLSMEGCSVGVGSLTSLFALTCLTSVDCQEVMQPPAGGAGAEAPYAPRVPAAWREGLLSLGWTGSASDATWPRVVPQLTSLTRLCMKDASVSPAFCRCAAVSMHMFEYHAGMP
jgi:hypothetical protein